MRAAELGAFLRSRRARVDPIARGFPAGRRRTPGLRREELASLAGVTVSWLTKLEQGQAHAVSAEVLDAVARALDLDSAERLHLFALAGYRLDEREGDDTRVAPALGALLDQLEPNPAYLLDRCWNIVAWNKAESRLFPRLHALAGATPNLLELVFLDDELNDLMADHGAEQARLVSQFRSHCADWPGDPAIERVIETLRDRRRRSPGSGRHETSHRSSPPVGCSIILTPGGSSSTIIGSTSSTNPACSSSSTRRRLEPTESCGCRAGLSAQVELPRPRCRAHYIHANRQRGSGAMAKGYIIFTEDVNDQTAMQEYVGKALPTIGPAGGRPIVFDPSPAVLEGEWHGPQTVVLEFESVEAARAWYESDDYQAVIGDRHAAANANVAILSGMD